MIYSSAAQKKCKNGCIHNTSTCISFKVDYTESKTECSIVTAKWHIIKVFMCYYSNVNLIKSMRSKETMGFPF